jgi:hypothetical protein
MNFGDPKKGRIFRNVTRGNKQNSTENRHRQVPYIISHSTDNSSDRKFKYEFCDSNSLKRHRGTNLNYSKDKGKGKGIPVQAVEALRVARG